MAELRLNPSTLNPVTVSLRAASLPAPTCTIGSCSPQAADAQGLERQALNQQQVHCVLQTLKGTLNEGAIHAEWYEEPQLSSSGRPLPIGLGFSIPLAWEDVLRIASHPFVEKVELAPLRTRSSGRYAATACPDASDNATAKVGDAASIQGMGRQPVVIELKDAGLLPAVPACADGSDTCPEAVNALWSRTIASTRNVTCVDRWIDENVGAVGSDVAYSEWSGSLDTPSLPPFGQLAMAQDAFGFALTWDEVNRVAAHPFVARIWTSPDIQFVPAMPGCPTDVSAPIPPVVCPASLGSSDGKISSADQAAFAAATGSIDVLVTVANGPTLCPLPTCATDVCPQRDAVTAKWQAQSLASQQCVRQEVMKVGGSNIGDAMWITDSFDASMTWAQIQVVAQHPQVVRIETAQSGMPPP